MLASHIVAACACFSTAACGAGAPASAARADAGPDTTPLREVRTVAARHEPWERTISAYGTLTADERATSTTKVPGRLKSLPIDLGSSVKEGDVIAEVDATDYELRLTNAEASLQQARARLGLPLSGDDDTVRSSETSMVRQAQALLDEVKLNRDRVIALREQSIASQSELDSVNAAYRVAESRLQDAEDEIQNRIAALVQRRAELAIARQQLADTRIVAPFDGVVLERRAGRGDYLAAGAPVAVIVRVDPLRLRVDVAEREASLVRTGQTVRFFIEGDSKVYAGEVVRTSPAIAVDNRTLLVEAEVANPEQGRSSSLRPGAFARVEIVVDRDARTLTVPKEAVVSFAGIDKVIVVQEGKAIERRIVIGRRTPERVEVVSGLEPGEEVVLGPGDLRSGAPVRAAR